MTLPALSKSMVIIGAGAIGVEFAYFYNAFGVKVTLVEFAKNILPIEDDEIVFLHAGLHNAPVRARRADDARVAAVRAEHARGVLLALGDRPRMVEQRAQCAALDAHVNAKHILA